MGKLGAAVIGCGSIHKMHADAISGNPNAALISVTDIDEERAKAATAQYGCSFHTDFMEALEDERVNVVHICTPHYLHAYMAIKALEKGKHVLTEKPMSISSADALDMIGVSQKTGMKLGVCFQNRYNTTSLRIKELIDSGSVGAVIGAKAMVTWYRDEKYYTESGWRGTWEKEGGGVLINQAIHALDLLQWFLGDIDWLKSNVDTRLLKDVIEVEDTAEATIMFKSGAPALFYATNCYRLNSPVEIEIVCEKAVIKLAGDATVTYENGLVVHMEETDARTGGKAYWGCSHAVLINDFYEKIITGDKFDIDGAQGIKTIRMIEAFYESSRTGRRVEF